ncbi:MAG: formate dehydrogenase subunit alpha [Betaproteobacteria bacterium]|nr:formate dehydrogenase subunit alpha [Betaproteobacteria bacterium]
MHTLIVNGQSHRVPVGLTLLQALRRIGCEVPTLCHDPRLKPIGGCRLCLVQVAGCEGLVSACNTPAEDGMQVATHTAEIEAERRTLLAWLARHYPPEAVEHEPDKPFHKLLRSYGVTALGEAVPGVPFIDASHPYLSVDMRRCVSCFRCVHICQELQGRSVWHALGRGEHTHIVPAGADSLLDSACVSCGACADTCPSGAIDDKFNMGRPPATQWTRTTCPYCGTGCELELGSRDGRVVATRPVLEAPVNKGHLCVKGRYAFDFNHAPDRVTAPMIRRNGQWHEVAWDEAIAFVAAEMTRIKRRDGADSLAVLGSARASNEDNYLAQKFSRLVLGTNNVDCCARVCHTPTAAAMKMMLGAGAATNSYDDIERAQLIMVCGANPTENHPIIGERIRQAVLRGARLIVLDPRRIELAGIADLHLAPRPGGNIPLFNAMAQVIVSEGLYDAAFVAGRVDEFDAFVDHLGDWTPERAAPLCGVSADLIRQAARLYASVKPALQVHGLGMTEHVQGTESVMALVNLALLTGNLGIEGAGVNPLRGQNNVQGAAHMGCDPGTLTGGAGLNDARDAFARHWGAPLPSNTGLNMLQMMDAAAAGRLKGLWCIGYDILHSNANMASTRQALAALELLVVQDMFLTETAREFAHVFLPAASSFEKDGTFMNAERRIQRIRAAVPAPGNARPDWRIVADLARALGAGEQFAFDSAEPIWNEITRVWPGAAGIDYARLDRQGLQWPCPSADHPGTAILHRDRFPIGPRAALKRLDFHASPESASEEFPFLLITGRTLYQFNAATMTGRTPNTLLRPTDTLDISPQDAARLGLGNGQRVRVRSRHGAAVLPLRISGMMKPGELFATFHDPAARLNAVTSPHRDRYVKAPEYKRTAISLELAEPAP